MNGQSVSQSYLQAIRDEGSSCVKCRRAATMRRGAMRLPCSTLSKRTMAQGFSGDMADYMRGSRDFWRNQCKLALAMP